MADTGKPAWPQTPDGTTDWEVVFEDPGTGFIQLIAQSPSKEILLQTTTLVLDKLFTRRGDEDEVERLKLRLEDIIAAPDDIASKHTKVGDLLRQVKNVRVEKARIYIERKNAGASIDRRAGLMWKIDFLLKPKVLIPVGLIFVIMLSGLIYTLLQTTLGTPRMAQEKSRVVVEEEPPRRQPAMEQKAKPSETVRPDTPEPEPVRIWLKTMRWPLSSMSAQERPQYYAVILYVKDWDIKIGVCRRVANIMDKLYQVFNHTLPQGRAATNEELAAAKELVPSALNQIFVTDVILNADVLRYGDPNFKSATLPPYCKSPDKP